MMGENGNQEPHSEIAHAMRRSTLALARQLRRMRSDHGVSAAKLALLSRLERLGRPMTASDLAQIERLQPQSITRLIADLEGKGLLARRQDAADKRQFLLDITDGGRALLQEDARCQSVWLARKMAETLTPSEREMLGIAAELMEKLSLPHGHEQPWPEGRQDLGPRDLGSGANLPK